MQSVQTYSKPINPTRKSTHSVLLYTGLASGWFADEPGILARLEGSLACVYSAYDTANGVYYPLANHGRLAAGFDGLCAAGNAAIPLPRVPSPGRPLDDD